MRESLCLKSLNRTDAFEPALQVVSGSSGKLVWQLALPEDWSDMTVSLAADTETAALYVAALGARYAIYLKLPIRQP